MAFVAFGRKKMNNGQQQLTGSENPNAETAADPAEDGSVGLQLKDLATPGVGHNDIEREGFKMEEDLDMEDDGLLTVGPGEHRAIQYFPGAAFCESPTFAEEKQQLELLESDHGGQIPQILQHNVALRRNFENLKQLHLQLTDANRQLQEAFLRLQDDKAKAEKELMRCGKLQREKGMIEADLEEMKSRHVKELSLLKSEHDEIAVLAQELEQKNRSLEKQMASMKGDNRDLFQKLDSARMEKEKVLIAKHTAELEYTRELSIMKVDDNAFRQQAADLAHKCKHLEVDLEKAVAAGDSVHQQLISLTFEKDSTIRDLEQALRSLREDFQAMEKSRRASENDWQTERQKLQSKIEEKDREEHMFKSKIREEADQKMKEASREISELHAMLVTLEKPRADAELLHLETVRELTKERETLRQELGAALSAHKEASVCLGEMEQIRAQLSDALAQNHESLLQIADLRNGKEELQKCLKTLKYQLAELSAIKDREREKHAHQLEGEQRKWAAEKSAVLMRTDKIVKEAQKDYSCKNRLLKKKLKQAQKLLATMTVDHNQLLVRVRECEAQLAIALSTKNMQFQQPYPAPVFPRLPVSLDCMNSARFKAEMKEVGGRQAKYFNNPDLLITSRSRE